ncbi:MAG: hypothetical protein U0791_16745 [Gemmataceae bacterium]
MNTIRLTTDGTFKSDPVFLKDGAEIVYTLLESPTQMRLMKLKLADRSVVKLHPDATTNEFEATFTADGSHYAFVQSRGNLNMKMVIRGATTGKDSVFDPGGGFAGVRRPAFHPKGERVAFAIPGETGQEIASVSRAGTDKKTLTTGGINNWPTYSPDGKRIAFCSSRDGTFDLFVMNADGTGAKPVIKLDGMQMRPAWSPDGTKLAFTSNHGGDGNHNIWTVSLDGTGLTRITDHPERDDYAAFHPDGKRIAFVGERKGKFDLFLANL